jgi:arsenical pump membrane protein
VLFVRAAGLVAAMTALLNLDTSVAFLTPVLVYTARRRGDGEGALLYRRLLLSNAGSRLLPGSNLTNLIVPGHLHLTGADLAARMALSWALAVAVTAAVVAVGERHSLHTTVPEPESGDRPVWGLGVVAVTAAVVLVLGSACWQSPSVHYALVNSSGGCSRCSACPCWSACSGWQ